MTKHIVLTTFAATAAATTGTAAAALAGDSLTTRNYGTRPKVIAGWQTLQTTGFTQMTWPTAHDTTRGLRVGGAAAATGLIIPIGVQLDITPQEVIAATLAATAVAGDVEQGSILTGYDVDKGQRLMTWEAVERRMNKWTSIEASIASAAGPAYSGTELINADSDLLKANTDYALIGFSCRTRIHCVGIVGPDTGNDRIGQPITLRPEFDNQFFKLQSIAHGEALIPVINSGNRNATNFFVATDENAGTFVITAHLAELK